MQGMFKFMSLRSMENVSKKYWDMIPIPDTVIDWVNLLGKYQPDLLVFTDIKGWLVVDGGVDLTVVDGDGN